MAKKRNRIASGFTIQDIMSMDMKKFESYSLKEQKEITSRLASAANKRFKTFERKEIVNPAVLKMQMEGGKISVKNKTQDELKEEYFRAKTFLKSKFSTQKGYKQYMEKLNDSLNIDQKGIYKGMNASLLYSTAFAYYDALQDISPSIQNVKDKYKIANKIAEFMQDGKDEKEIFKDVFSWLSKEYEQMQEKFNETSVSFGNRLDEEDTPTRFKRKGL